MYVIYWSKQMGTLIIALFKCPNTPHAASNTSICTILVQIDSTDIVDFVAQLLGASSEGDPGTFQKVGIAFNA